MPRKGYRPPDTTAANIYIPNGLHRKALAEVNSIKRDRAPGYSLQQFILDAMQERIDRINQKGVSTMTKVALDWSHENRPGWDGTGTIAESWNAVHGRYACRIDRFTEEEGGGFAYTVSIQGNPIRDGENEAAESFEDAEAKVLALIQG